MPRPVEMLKKEVAEKLPADLDGLAATLARLQGLLERAHAYCDDVVVRCPCWPCACCGTPRSRRTLATCSPCAWKLDRRKPVSCRRGGGRGMWRWGATWPTP